MQRRLTPERVFALRGFTIKTTDGKFWVAPTAYFNEKQKWAGPYKSLQHATTAIARKLQAEFTKREARSK